MKSAGGGEEKSDGNESHGCSFTKFTPLTLLNIIHQLGELW